MQKKKEYVIPNGFLKHDCFYILLFQSRYFTKNEITKNASLVGIVNFRGFKMLGWKNFERASEFCINAYCLLDQLIIIFMLKFIFKNVTSKFGTVLLTHQRKKISKKFLLRKIFVFPIFCYAN